MRNLLVLLIFELFSLGDSFKCGQPKVDPDIWPKNPRDIQSIRHLKINNGLDALAKSYPSYVSMQVLDGHGELRHICGASPIAKNWVLSAAHCFEKFDNYVLRFGIHNTSLYEETVKEEHVTIHPKWLDGKGIDAALLRLPNPITFDDYVQPICLTRDSSGMKNENPMVVVGLGWDSRHMSHYLLQEALVNVTCQSGEVPKVTHQQAYPTSFCTQSVHNMRSNRGDSGGPNMAKVNGKWYQYGIVSIGQKKEWGTIDWPEAVPPLCDWIKEVTGEELCDQDKE